MPADTPPATAQRWAERAGLSPELSRHLIAAAAQQSRGWPLPRGAAFTVSVAINAQSLVTAGWVDGVLESCKRHRLAPQRLCLELHEDQLAQASEAVVAAMQRLRAAGVQLGLSGFGAGQSSFAVLRRQPVDRLRLDRGSLRQLADDATARKIVRTLIQLAGTLGLDVVADGVESAGTAATLHALGCPAAQGSLFGSALDAEQVAGLLTAPAPLWIPRSA